MQFLKVHGFRLSSIGNNKIHRAHTVWRSFTRAGRLGASVRYAVSRTVSAKNAAVNRDFSVTHNAHHSAGKHINVADTKRYNNFDK